MLGLQSREGVGGWGVGRSEGLGNETNQLKHDAKRETIKMLLSKFLVYTSLSTSRKSREIVPRQRMNKNAQRTYDLIDASMISSSVKKPLVPGHCCTVTTLTRACVRSLPSSTTGLTTRASTSWGLLPPPSLFRRAPQLHHPTTPLLPLQTPQHKAGEWARSWKASASRARRCSGWPCMALPLPWRS